MTKRGFKYLIDRGREYKILIIVMSKTKNPFK